MVPLALGGSEGPEKAFGAWFGLPYQFLLGYLVFLSEASCVAGLPYSFANHNIRFSLNSQKAVLVSHVSSINFDFIFPTGGPFQLRNCNVLAVNEACKGRRGVNQF